MPDLVHVVSIDDGAFWRVTFGAAKGNVLDGAMMAALDRVFLEARGAAELKAVCLEGHGGHFSFGASVQEHLPAQVEPMLAALRQLLLNILDCHVFVLAAVRGQCLGGGLELASVCHRIVADAGARFGQPEIALGVFPPVASIVLPIRIGRAHAEDLCLTGRTISAAEAREMGLVDEISAGDPADAAIGWAQRHLTAHSASSLRLAVKAIRRNLAIDLRSELPALERLYLDELMTTHDAKEGLTAFLEKRTAKWRNA